MIHKICVFCGSSSGIKSSYAEAAKKTAEALAHQHKELVFGGGKIGLMGILADEMMRLGGKATGVIVTSLVQKEIAHGGLSRLYIVESMHERKQKMYELSDAFIALPGGMGTLDEFFEILTWAQLGIHSKPCGILNQDGYYNRLLEFIDHAVAEGFIKPKHRSKIFVSADPLELLRLMEK